MNLEGAVCVVTGVGRGIGREISMDLARRGATVFGCDVSTEALREFENNAAENGMNVDVRPCDVSDEGSVSAFFEHVMSHTDRLDVLVNNAGIMRDGLLVRMKDGQLTRMSLADFQSVLDVNLTGVFLCAREAASIMVARGGGIIINMSSISRAGNFGQTNYAASKAGVAAMTVTWSKELARYGIRVAAIAPGLISTDMVMSMKPSILDKIISTVPVGRLGKPSEISCAVQFIIENDFVNGRILEIDGGLRM